VLVGACDALSTPRPLAPLADIARGLGGEVRHLLESAGRRDEVFGALLAAFEAEPRLVIFEDIHWADEATLDLMTFLGRRISSTRTLLVARTETTRSARPTRCGSCWARWRPRGRSEDGSFAPVDTGRRRVGGRQRIGRIGPRRAAPADRGNPFFVTEVLASGGGIPATVRDAVLARVAPLSTAARAVLDASAVIGSPVDPALLRQVTGPALDAIDECLAVGVLRAEGRRSSSGTSWRGRRCWTRSPRHGGWRCMGGC
jgi:hypothetical protein